MKPKSLLLTITMALLIGLISNASAYTLDVLGSNDLSDPVRTGLTFTAGQSFSVTNVAGQFTMELQVPPWSVPPVWHQPGPVPPDYSGSGRSFVSPDGTSSNLHFNQRPETFAGQTFYTGTLVGQVGSSPYFSIGKGDYSGNASTSGELKLAMWGDPSGAVTHIDSYHNGLGLLEMHGGGVTVNATPIPGVAWLLGSGLIGLIGLKRRKSSVA